MFSLITQLFFCQLKCSAQLLAKVCLNCSSRGAGFGGNTRLGIRKLGFEPWLCHFLTLRCWQFTSHIYLRFLYPKILYWHCSREGIAILSLEKWGSPSFSECTRTARAAAARPRFPGPGHSCWCWLFITVSNTPNLILFFCVGFL